MHPTFVTSHIQNTWDYAGVRFDLKGEFMIELD